ncbi:hypothetical protein IV38_GL000272 [Lactobacillus selangorensis]|uniref:Uncharacterized protein n=1 Tax=Lactobacillus selangorensis TaxID=81857 RepID=A0A0R2FZZ5_9LACO|nr:hypothetical protein [Lactobacillus selangorensis]KRN29388.1 hypothetical protein IV38_GL000272 [Lactobacillus selangorensis]KRN34083.1 hypothetical protein IV40_GL000397 [Lactobacillus selangorensis]
MFTQLQSRVLFGPRQMGQQQSGPVIRNRRSGLTAKEIRTRRQRTVTLAVPRSHQMNHGRLFGASLFLIISLLFGRNWLGLGLVSLAAMLLIGITFQLWHTAQTARQRVNLLADQTYLVIRHGLAQALPARELVAGDTVILSQGETAPVPMAYQTDSQWQTLATGQMVQAARLVTSVQVPLRPAQTVPTILELLQRVLALTEIRKGLLGLAVLLTLTNLSHLTAMLMIFLVMNLILGGQLPVHQQQTTTDNPLAVAVARQHFQAHVQKLKALKESIIQGGKTLDFVHRKTPAPSYFAQPQADQDADPHLWALA